MSSLVIQRPLTPMQKVWLKALKMSPGEEDLAVVFIITSLRFILFIIFFDLAGNANLSRLILFIS